MAKSEILAPVGNEEMLYAGLAAGASSFYMAVDDFGARAYAKNFDIENVGSFIDLIHLFGKKVFVTMNILIKDEEMEKAIYYAKKLYEYGADALIIQDLGLFTILKDQVPGMDLHASTQMAVRDYYGAKSLMDMGFARVVIARETPIEELRKIATLPVEKEVFVHGSLCVSYSGECLMSSYFGARSANRGRCAGICRQKYSLISDGKTLADDYFLNMRDLNVIDEIDQLVELGIDCFKIEGRMKSPEYVYTSVKSYKDKIEKNSYDRNNLRDISNRGYTKGFIFGQKSDYVRLSSDAKHRSVGKVIKEGNKKYFINSSDLLLGDNLEITTDKGKKLPFTLTENLKKNSKTYLDQYPDAKEGSEVYILNSQKIGQNLEKSLGEYESLPIAIDFRAMVDGPAKITMTYKDWSISLETEDKLERAKKISLTEEDLRENLSKFGDDIYQASQINIFMDPDVFIRKKDINRLRREGSAKLKEEILKSFRRDEVDIEIPQVGKKKNHKKEVNAELKNTNVDPKLLSGFDNIYLEEYDGKYAGLSLYLNLNSHTDYDIDELIAFIKEKTIKGVVFNNYRDLAFIDKFMENNIKIRIGRYLNVFNKFTYDFYDKFAEMTSSSVEATFDSINQNGRDFNVEALAFGRIELMNMVHCPFSTIKKCGLRGCSTCKFRNGEMVNENGDRLKIIRRNCISRIYPARASKVDRRNFTNDISFLVQVFSDEDIRDYQDRKETNNLNYDRGVI